VLNKITQFYSYHHIMAIGEKELQKLSAQAIIPGYTCRLKIQ